MSRLKFSRVVAGWPITSRLITKPRAAVQAKPGGAAAPAACAAALSGIVTMAADAISAAASSGGIMVPPRRGGRGRGTGAAAG